MSIRPQCRKGYAANLGSRVRQGTVEIGSLFVDETVIALLKHLTEAAGVDVANQQNPVVLTIATISRLGIVTIPLALYFWLIKLVVRFNIRSMLLMDDAGQRATIIET